MRDRFYLRDLGNQAQRNEADGHLPLGNIPVTVVRAIQNDHLYSSHAAAEGTRDGPLSVRSILHVSRSATNAEGI